MFISALFAILIAHVAEGIVVPITASHFYEFDMDAPDWLNRFAALGFSAWGNHAIFAKWLVGNMHPQLIVDLGIDLGYSTFVWSTALNEVSAGGRVVGIDSFQFQVARDTSPDLVRDAYGFVQGIIAKFHPEYANVEVVKGFFSDVSAAWTGGRTVDVLHVDGRHEYEHVREDYFAWNKHVHPDGIVLFHDCYVWDQENFGVYRFFDEITEYRFRGHFENDYGLGVATNNQLIFTAITMNFPNFKIGSKVAVPPNALPSYLKVSPPPAEFVVDIADVAHTDEITLFAPAVGSQGGGSPKAFSVVSSVRQPWSDFVAKLDAEYLSTSASAGAGAGAGGVSVSSISAMVSMIE